MRTMRLVLAVGVVGLVFGAITTLAWQEGQKSILRQVRQDMYFAYHESVDTLYENVSEDKTDGLLVPGRCFSTTAQDHIIKWYPGKLEK